MARVMARCERPIGYLLNGAVLLCGAPMQLMIKAPKVWSYQERVSERCTMGHIAHAQAVLPESWEAPIDDGRVDNWGTF